MDRTIYIPKRQMEVLTKEIENAMDPSSMDRLYWLCIPDDLLNPVQKEHLANCGPYIVGIEIENDKLNIEYLIRARTILHCDCIKMADAKQKKFINKYIDTLLLRINITPVKILDNE